MGTSGGILGLNKTRRLLHAAFRSWRRSPKTIPALFREFHVLRETDLPWGATETLKRKSLWGRLRTQTITLLEDHPGFAELLLDRFEGNKSTRQVAFANHISVDQVNRLQRAALDALAVALIDVENVTRRRTTQAQLAKIPLPSYQEFVGREDLVKQLGELLAHPGAPWVVAMTGLGGIGKTSLAQKVTHGLIQHGAFDDIYWLSEPIGNVPPNGEELLGSLGHSFPPTQDKAPSNDEIRQTLRNRSCLVILDGQEDLISSPAWLEILADLTNPTKFLLISRGLPNDLANVYVIKLPELDHPAAQELTEKYALANGLEQHLPLLNERRTEIYDLVGGNPLALKLLVGLLHVLPFQSILASFGRQPSQSIENLFLQIYQANWASLESETRHLFLSTLLTGPEGATERQLVAISGIPLGRLYDSLSTLTRRCLLELRGTGEGRYSLHRLTETYLRTHLGQGSGDLRNFNACIKRGLAYWHTEITQRGAAEVFAAEESNVLQIMKYSVAESLYMEQTAQILTSLGGQLLTRANTAGWCEALAKAYKQQDDPKQGCALGNLLGAMQWKREEFSNALATFADVEARARQARLTEAEAIARLGQGLVSWATGDLDQARAIVKSIKVKSGNRRLEGQAEFCLGLIAFSAGYYSRAEGLFRRAIRHSKSDSGFSSQLRVNRGLCLYMKGDALGALKQFALAAEELSELAAKREFAHLELLRSAAFFQMGDMRNAQASLDRAAKESRLHEDPVGRAFLESSLGRVYLEFSRKTKAGRVLANATKLWAQAGKPGLMLNAEKVVQRIWGAQGY